MPSRLALLRQRSWHQCQQLGDLLRVAGGVGSDAAAEAVDGRAKAMQLRDKRSRLIATPDWLMVLRAASAR